MDTRASVFLRINRKALLGSSLPLCGPFPLLSQKRRKSHVRITQKVPRQRFREEHAQFLEGLSAGLTDLEIMRRMGWTKLQLKRHQAEAFAAGHQRAKAAYRTVFLADMPEDIRGLFPDASPDALLKIETDVSGFIASLL